MSDWFNECQTAFEQVLKKLLPNDSASQIKQKTIGLLGVYFNYHTLHHLADKTFREHSYQPAMPLKLSNSAQFKKTDKVISYFIIHSKLTNAILPS